MLCIAPSARISRFADIEDSTRGTRIVIGDDVVIDAFVKIKPAGGSGDLMIGRGSVINSGCVLYTGHGIQIGRNVLVAANCTFAPANHAFADPARPIRTQGFQADRGGIVVGDDVWIGANTVLVDGARIGTGSIVGAASLVRCDLPEFCVAFGVPATVQGWRRLPSCSAGQCGHRGLEDGDCDGKTRPCPGEDCDDTGTGCGGHGENCNDHGRNGDCRGEDWHRLGETGQRKA